MEKALSKGTAAISAKLGVPSLDDLFKKMDKDGSGFIELNEFKHICNYMGIKVSQDNVIKVFAISDRKKRRKLNLMEF